MKMQVFALLAVVALGVQGQNPIPPTLQSLSAGPAAQSANSGSSVLIPAPGSMNTHLPGMLPNQGNQMMQLQSNQMMPNQGNQMMPNQGNQLPNLFSAAMSGMPGAMGSHGMNQVYAHANQMYQHANNNFMQGNGPYGNQQQEQNQNGQSDMPMWPLFMMGDGGRKIATMNMLMNPGQAGNSMLPLAFMDGGESMLPFALMSNNGRGNNQRKFNPLMMAAFGML